MNRNNSHKAYGFHFKGEHQERVAGIYTIGKEIRTEHTYIWDGLKRSEEGKVVFQYTLNGNGAIRIEDTTYSLMKGQAFLVKLPSDHCYYLPAESNQWEFIYITLFGTEALHYYTLITEKYGHIFQFPTNSRPIKQIFRLLEKIETTGILHGYEASGYAYSFLMEFMQYIEHDQSKEVELPLAIAKAVSFLEKKYADDLTLDDIVKVSGLSKYHFTRLFARTMQVTPIQFLTKIRMKQAVELLQDNSLSIEDIAKQVGYRNGNYFSKVFKSILNITPSEYRNNQSYMPVDQLFID
ncbi:AraC-type DNA-binding protein [Gracilibacillus ureilyticus]|uniref:AraC-type DNA-binding protein n=1 Tax=Gracilibacillus ureilyticus TaxID=531814 RepID=A0A1H9SYK6_9BACI|nr:AraC family transcriptional regulator [Gracilibacillus ureilyticus]SER89917.1 AraC-type DNA-binding protein [Gracilibacillus ureilyticus]